jgi:hypothetical protein
MDFNNPSSVRFWRRSDIKLVVRADLVCLVTRCWTDEQENDAGAEVWTLHESPNGKVQRSESTRLIRFSNRDMAQSRKVVSLKVAGSRVV